MQYYRALQRPVLHEMVFEKLSLTSILFSTVTFDFLISEGLCIPLRGKSAFYLYLKNGLEF